MLVYIPDLKVNISAAMSIKRKYIAKTISEKLDILYEVDKKVKTKTEIAKDFGIPLSTLSTYLKNRKAIELQAVEGNKINERKRIRTAKHVDVERELFDWFCQARANNIPLSGPFVKEKAKYIALKMGIDFECSNGWLQRFQHRHNISALCIKGEGASVDIVAAEQWRESVMPILKQYTPQDTFNMDETGLFYNMKPERTLSLKGETCRGGKKCKERLTVLLCCNADGSEKLKPLVVGKFEKPRCMKGITHLPCEYRANKNAWITSKLFSDWLVALERRMACQNRKILLLIDQCAAHNFRGLNLNNVRVMYLPANTTSYMQPLDQGIIYCLKRAYRKRLVRYYLREMERNVPVNDLRKWNVLEAMRGVSVAWESISDSVIKNCFAKAGFGIVSDVCEETAVDNDVEWAALRDQMECPNTTFDDFINIDSTLSTFVDFEATDTDTLATEASELVEGEQRGGEEEGGEEEEGEEEIDEQPKRPTREEAYAALSALEAIINTSNVQVDGCILKAADTITEFVTQSYKMSVKQKTLHTYFVNQQSNFM